MKRLAIIFAVALITALLVGPQVFAGQRQSGQARAATITVTNLNDSGSGSLRQAIASAAAGDTIDFAVTGIITLTSGDLVINKNLAIAGPGAASLTIDGNHAYRGFYISAGDVTISGLTVRNGQASIGDLNLYRGGGIYQNDYYHTLTLNSMRIVSNTTPGGDNGLGGGVYSKGPLVLNNIVVDGNVAGYAGGVYNLRMLTMNGGTVSNNRANSSGGGINAIGPLTLTHVIVSGNRAISDKGGGLYTWETTLLNHVVITNNQAPIDGGGLYTRNYYSNQPPTVTLMDVTIISNTTYGSGGGLNNYYAAVTLNRVTIANNTAHDGGGIFSLQPMTLTNVTISGNEASSSGSGGGICNASTLKLTNVSIVSNTTGGIYNFDVPLTLKNTLIANNTPAEVNCTGTLTSLGHNLDSGNTCGLTSSGDLTNTNPLVGPLADNGGATLTHALLIGSPAIDAGTNAGCPSIDQRGWWRPADGDENSTAICDIGAYEHISNVRNLFLPLILR